MRFRFFALLAVSGLAAFGAAAQSGPMDTCRSEDACDAASDKLITEAATRLKTGRHREAAQLIYPAVLSNKTSPLAKARAATAFSDILVEAKLYDYAAVQIENANATTRAPSSGDLIKYARLLARTDDRDATLAAYAKAEAQARAAANVPALDQIAADYGRLGEGARASALRAQRGEVSSRARQNCAEADCTQAPLVDARVLEYGPVKYPSEARRKDGECTVRLNVTEDGRPVDLQPDCTDPVFIGAAMDAVQESSFSPRFENGVPTPRYNIVVPFSFSRGR